MNFTYKIATIEDLDVLTKTRVEVLRAANKLDDTVDMTQVEKESRDYYQRAFADDSHVAVLVFDGEQFVGAGGVSFYTVMPTYHNPSGKKAYIMNMYTKLEHRRKGIAFHTLDILVDACRKRNVTHITLEATDMGRKLYEKYGFVAMYDEMQLPE